MIRVLTFSLLVLLTTAVHAQNVKLSSFSGFERAQIVYENFDEPNQFKDSYGTANVSLLTTGIALGVENRFTDYFTFYYAEFRNRAYDPRTFDDTSFIGDFILEDGYSFGIGIENSIHTFIRTKNGSQLFFNGSGGLGMATMNGKYRYEDGLNDGREIRRNRFEFNVQASLEAEINLNLMKLSLGYSPIGFRMGYIRNAISYNGFNVSLIVGR
ncbi:MAG: hypothetical protein JJ966_10310 [Balneolaceae bacterium]|nr:hypothetical protein [Balneolaceae bacterium]